MVTISTMKQQEYLTLLAEQHPSYYEEFVGKGRKPETLSNTVASTKIDRIKRSVKEATSHHAGSQRAIVKDWLIRHDLKISEVEERLMKKVGGPDMVPGGWKGLIFSTNRDGQRVPKPIPQQKEDFRSLVETLAKELKQKKQKKDVPEKKQAENKYRELLNFTREVRNFCLKRAADGHPLDEVGIRPLEYGLAMLRQDIPMVAVKDAMTIHYPPEARRTLGIRDYDVQKFRTKDRKPGVHAALPYVLALVQAKVPVALVGPKGTGKTTLARHVSEHLELDFGFVSMTSGTSPSAFNGRPKIGGDGGVVQSQFEKIYAKGGVFLFDEMDAADENLLLLVNAALANGYFANTATGEVVRRNDNFVPMCGMNTLGLGAGRDYNSRNKLDAATLDRWNLGRVRIALDPRIEENLVTATEKAENLA